MDPEDLAGDPVQTVWEDLIADASATAAEYEADGWETLELRPGDVTPLDGEYGDRVGLDVLVPDNEYRALQSWFDDGFAIDDYEVYRSLVDRTVFLLVALRDGEVERVVLLPTFYRLGADAVSGMFEHAGETGALHVYVRRLSGEYAEIRLDDPALFAPPADDGNGDGSGDGPGDD